MRKIDSPENELKTKIFLFQQEIRSNDARIKELQSANTNLQAGIVIYEDAITKINQK